MSRERAAIATAWHIALDQIKRGAGRREEVEMVADALNLALMRKRSMIDALFLRG